MTKDNPIAVDVSATELVCARRASSGALLTRTFANTPRGAVVIDWTDTNLLEIFDLRALLEAYAASLAATRITDAEVALMRAEAERFHGLTRRTKGLDLRAIAESNNRLHRMILDAGRNPRLASMLVAVVHIPLVRQTFAKYSHESLARSAMQHLDLVSAIEARDPVWAEAAMRAHIHAAKKVIFGAVTEQPIASVKPVRR